MVDAQAGLPLAGPSGSAVRVLVVIPAMSPEAGAEQSLYAVTPYLLSAGLEVSYAVLTEHQGLIPGLLAMGVGVSDLSGLGPIARMRRLRRQVRTQRPDVVHATLFQASWLCQVACFGTGVPLLVSWANTPLAPGSEGVPAWKTRIVKLVDAGLGRLSRSRYHAVTVGVARTKAADLHVPPGRVRVAERGRDPSVYRPPDPAGRAERRAVLGLSDDELVFLAIGRQEPQKGYVDLLAAFDRAAAARPELRLLIAGRSGSASPEIEAALTGLHHADRVSLLGHRDDVAELLAAADVVVCASHREGAAGALIEAMGVGTPILTVDLDGMRGTLVDGETAVVVDRSHLAEGIERIAADPDLRSRLAARCRALFLERFTDERSAAALADVYRWAVASSSA